MKGTRHTQKHSTPIKEKRIVTHGSLEGHPCGGCQDKATMTVSPQWNTTCLWRTGKTYPECGRQHLMSRAIELNKKEEVSQEAAFSSLWFLTGDAMWLAASHSGGQAFSTMTDCILILWVKAKHFWARKMAVMSTSYSCRVPEFKFLPCSAACNV